jgi:hypothetical protein
VVGVHDRLTLWWLASPAGHVQRVDDQLGAQVIGDRPAHDAAGPGVDDTTQIDLALGGRVLGDVAAPEPIRTVHAEVAIDQVRIRRGRRVAAGTSPPAARPMQPDDAMQAHEALHLFVIDPPAEAEAQLMDHPRVP